MMLRASLALFSFSLLAAMLHADDGFGPLPPPVAASHSFKAQRSVDGNLVGQVNDIQENGAPTAAREGRVLIGRDGNKAADLPIGPNGVFQVPGLADGLYSFIVQSPAGFATFGQFVAGNSTKQHVVGVTVDLVPAIDMGFVRDVIMSAHSSGVAAGGGQVVPNDILQKIQAHGSLSVDNAGLTRGYILVPEATQVRAADHMSVWFVKDGRPVASGQTNDMGLFEVKGLAPGRYSLVASGPVGIYAASMDVVRGAIPAVNLPLVETETQMVWVDGGAVAVTPSSPADLALIRGSLPVGLVGPGALPPGGIPGGMAGGGFGTAGGFGGGGGGGGGGLLGALLGAGLGAGIGAAIAADDDNKVIIVSPPGP